MIVDHTVLTRAADVRFRAVENETVVVRQQAAEAIVLNEVAGRILDLIDGKRTVGSIAEALAAEYEVDGKQLSEDVRDYAEELVSIGIAELV